MRTLLSLFILASFISCSSDNDEPITIPQCVDDYIPIFEPMACVGTGDLTKWIFNGQDVYCFNQGNCISDGAAIIFDSSCVEICTLGTIAGITDCQGINWADNAELVGLVFRY